MTWFLNENRSDFHFSSSIYEGDPAFTANLDEKKFQYKYGDDGTSRSFILELSWSQDYPLDSIANVSMDTFYNKHLLPDVKSAIVDSVKAEAEQYLGMSMTYSLIEFVKENLDGLLEKQPETISKDESADAVVAEVLEQNLVLKEKSPVKKTEQLTKAQKRRMWDKGGLQGEDRPRGWDWIDVIRHLSQTGAKE